MEALPLEILNLIILHLPVPDISTLRLSCHALNNSLCRTSHLRRVFQHKTIRFSVQGMKQFARVTKTPGMCCLLEHCTVAGIAEDPHTRRCDDFSDTLENALFTGFGNLRRFSKTKALKSLTFTMTAGDYDKQGRFVVSKKLHDRRAVWDQAPYVFHMVLDALVGVKLKVLHKLDLYSDRQGCSMVYSYFTNVGKRLACFDFNPFDNTRQLRVSLCAPIKPPRGDEEEEDGYDSDAADMEDASPKATLGNILRVPLQCMPQLESVDLHWYDVGNHWEAYPAKELSTPLGEPDLPVHHLRELTVRGFFTTLPSLQKALQATTPDSLTLKYINLPADGQWRDVLSHLANADQKIGYYYLEDVFQNTKLVHFNGPGSLKFPYLEGEMQWPSTLLRQGEQVHNVVECRASTKRVLGSPQHTRWVRFSKRDYGPQQGPYDLMAWVDAPPDVLWGPDSEGEQTRDQ